MKKIETDSDVREWAKAVVEANGDMFTPLSKGEQFVIAKFIVVENGGCGDRDPSSESDVEPESDTATAEEVHADVPPTSTTEAPSVCSVSVSENPTMQTIQVTRSDFLRGSGLDAQQAFDKFLKWCEEHPKEGSVMDFSSGVKSRDAAFAYWLCDKVLTEVPVAATCTM